MWHWVGAFSLRATSSATLLRQCTAVHQRISWLHIPSTLEPKKFHCSHPRTNYFFPLCGSKCGLCQLPPLWDCNILTAQLTSINLQCSCHWCLEELVFHLLLWWLFLLLNSPRIKRHVKPALLQRGNALGNPGKSDDNRKLKEKEGKHV